MPPWSYTNPMWRDAMREVLEMIEGETGAEADEIRAEATEREKVFDGWLTGAPPTDEDRKAAVSSVTTLFKRARNLLRDKAEALRPRDPAPSHPGQ